MISKEIAFEILDDDSDEWRKISEEVVGEKRWNLVYRVVCKNLIDNKFYEFFYERSKNDDGDSPFEYEEPVLFEVEPRETIEYVRKK